jgi:hypothetical protein
MSAFTFDVKKARNRQAEAANPAKPANPSTPKAPISSISRSDDPNGLGYTLADLKEMDKLLRELAQLEGWTLAELEEMLDRRRRMAPARVPQALKDLRAGSKAALAPWPEKPARRAVVVLTVLEGGKANKGALDQAKTLDSAEVVS